MRLRVGRVGIVTLLAAAALLASGCTGTDPLRSGNTSLTLDFDSTPLTGRFDNGLFEISQILVRPTVESAAGALDTSTLGFLRATVAIDLVRESENTLTIPLSAGTFEVLGATVSSVQLTDSDGSASSDNCFDFLASHFESAIGTITNLGPQPIYLQVREDGSSRLTVSVDGDALVQAFFDASSCQSLTNRNFANFTFLDAAPNYLTVTAE